MDRINRSGTGIASLGRDEDQFLAHVALGERVVPPVISAATQARINQEMRAAGLDPNEYAVGSGMSINPITGLPEFGFFKKAFKSIKKVAKKAAPLAMLVPGVGSALGALAGGLGTGITSLVGSIPGVGGALSSGLGTIGKAISGGIGSLGKMMPGGFGEGFQNFSQFAEGTGLGGGALRDSLKTALSGGIGGLTQGGPLNFLTQGINPVAEYTPMSDTMDGQITGYMGPNGQIISVNDYNQMVANKGSFFGTKTPRFLKGIEDTLKGQTDPRSASLFKGIGAIPSKIGDAVGAFPGGGFGLGATALLAKAVYDDAKEREGGLSLTPQVMMDSLGRYQLSSDLGTGGDRGQFGLAPKPAVLDIANMGQRQAFATGDEVVYDIPKMEFGPVGGFSKDSYLTLGIPKSYQDRSENPGILKELLAGWASMSVQGGELARENSPKYIEAIKQESGLQEGDPILDRILQEALKREVEGRNKFAVGGVAELDLREGGESIGPGTGTSDDIPAMLSDGEFVMTAAATRGAGAFNMKKNKSGIELIKGGKPSREDGVKNMRELMNIFEGM